MGANYAKRRRELRDLLHKHCDSHRTVEWILERAVLYPVRREPDSQGQSYR